MLEFDTIHLVTFLSISSLVMLTHLLLEGRADRLSLRLRKLQGKEEAPNPKNVSQLALAVLPKMGAAVMPDDEDRRTLLQTRLIHAGYYSRQAMVVFLGLKTLLTIGPAILGLLLGLANLIPMAQGVIFGAMLGVSGMIGPSFWLDNRKAARQTAFRRALPDALDVLVICLEGGLSLTGAIRRVTSELRTAHPALAMELAIVQREVQLGRSAGEALRNFAERCDLEELRSLASVISQSERYGASLVKALRVHSETLRGKRLQYAEEMAQKAAIKILFPTLLFIFPAIFVVIMGPACIMMADTFGRLQQSAETNRGQIRSPATAAEVSKAVSGN